MNSDRHPQRDQTGARLEATDAPEALTHSPGRGSRHSKVMTLTLEEEQQGVAAELEKARSVRVRLSQEALEGASR